MELATAIITFIGNLTLIAYRAATATKEQLPQLRQEARQAVALFVAHDALIDETLAANDRAADAEVGR